jgi:hypothetical protein
MSLRERLLEVDWLGETQVRNGETLKQQGMERARLARKELLIAARIIARDLADKAEYFGDGITIDDVMEVLETKRFSSADLGNAAGSVFLKRDFVFTGEWRKSKRTSSHARMIRVWRLR